MRTASAIAPIALAMLLSGCVMDEFGGFGAPDPDAPRVLPPEVTTALPRGMNPDFAMQSGDGCWLLVLEVQEPLTGIPLRNDLGERVCTA